MTTKNTKFHTLDNMAVHKMISLWLANNQQIYKTMNFYQAEIFIQICTRGCGKL